MTRPEDIDDMVENARNEALENEYIQQEKLADQYSDLQTIRARALSYSSIENLEAINPEIYDFAYMVFTMTDGILKDLEENG